MQPIHDIIVFHDINIYISRLSRVLLGNCVRNCIPNPKHFEALAPTKTRQPRSLKSILVWSSLAQVYLEVTESKMRDAPQKTFQNKWHCFLPVAEDILGRRMHDQNMLVGCQPAMSAGGTHGYDSAYCAKMEHDQNMAVGCQPAVLGAEGMDMTSASCACFAWRGRKVEALPETWWWRAWA